MNQLKDRLQKIECPSFPTAWECFVYNCAVEECPSFEGLTAKKLEHAFNFDTALPSPHYWIDLVKNHGL